MLSITSSQPVHWPLSPSPAVAAVTPVDAVAPAKGQPRDQASGFGSDTPQDRRGSTDKAPSQAKAAPILPLERPEGVRRGETSSVGDAARTKEKAREAQMQADAKAAQPLQLQEVLSSVWKASAAVVDVMLGRDASAGHVSPGADMDAVIAPSGASRAGAADGAPAGGVPSQTQQPAIEGDAPSLAVRMASEPVTYDDQGSSVWGVLETGTHLNQTV